jgi:hypothetical protein
MTPVEALALLNTLDAAGGITTRGPSWTDVYAGDVTFVAPSGHVVVVFNDCDDWDYIDRIEAPDGTVLWEFCVTRHGQLPYYPPSEDDWKVIDWHPADDRTWTQSTMGYCGRSMP